MTTRRPADRGPASASNSCSLVPDELASSTDLTAPVVSDSKPSIPDVLEAANHGNGRNVSSNGELTPSAPEALAGIVRVGAFAGFVQRFEDLIGSSTRMVLYFIHSRRWRENHDAAIKAFLGRDGTRMEVFLPDLESHELMFSLARHFDDGPAIPGLVADAYRYFARLARDFNKPAEVWLFARYPTYSFYQFDDRAVIAMYSNTAAKKDLPAFEITAGCVLGKFLATDIEDLKAECRRRAPDELETVIADATP